MAGVAARCPRRRAGVRTGAGGRRLSTGHRFCMRVGRLIEAPWDVIEFEAVELVLQSSDFLVVHNHLGIMVARLLHDLVDNQLGVTSDVEASDPQLHGNA